MHENRQVFLDMETYINTNFAKGESQDFLQAQLQMSRLGEKLQTNGQL
ncbi:MAG: hypothetical protein GY920_10020 [Aliivibrio sp.]|nr:hypothetical protein [Aliivibrio sp.]